MSIPTSDNLNDDMPVNLHAECKNAIRLHEGGVARKPLKHVPRRLGRDD